MPNLMDDIGYTMGTIIKGEECWTTFYSQT
jgi:hypothetical protein